MTTFTDADNSYDERQQHEAYIAELERRLAQAAELLDKEFQARNDTEERERRRQRIQMKVREELEAERLASLAPADRPIVLSEMEAANHYSNIAGKTLIDGIMPRKGTGSLYGPSGAGKSFVYLYRALCLAKP